jgi:hypothetical protein
MTSNDPNLGWDGPEDILLALRTAVIALSRGGGRYQDRMTKVVEALAGVGAERFPERIRNRATAVLSMCGRIYRSIEYVRYCDVRRVTPRQRDIFTKDILSLYEACLIDLGRLSGDDYYPNDRPKPSTTSNG